MATTMHCAPKCPAASEMRRGIADGGGVDAHLVGARVEQRADVGDRVDAAADGERNEHLVGHGLDHVVEKPARLDARADVEERELVGALLVVAARDLDRIAGVAQVDEVDALDDAAGGDVETGNDALGEAHEGARRANGRVSPSRPSAPP